MNALAQRTPRSMCRKCIRSMTAWHTRTRTHTHMSADAPMHSPGGTTKWSGTKELSSLKIEFERSVVKIYKTEYARVAVPASIPCASAWYDKKGFVRFRLWLAGRWTNAKNERISSDFHMSIELFYAPVPVAACACGNWKRCNVTNGTNDCCNVAFISNRE